MPTIYGIALSNGEPAAGVYVKLIGHRGEFVAEKRTLEDGIFEFNVTEGTWTLHWLAPGKDMQEGQVEVTGDEDAEVELET